jgi:hypothetical protein
MKNISIFSKPILFLAVTCCLLSCSKNGNLIQSELNGNWKVISFDDNISMTRVFKTSENTWPEYNNGENTICFNKTNQATGDISGKNVTNTFNGLYEISTENKITVKDVGWTKINEPEWGRLFHTISSAEEYEITGSILRIFYNQKKNSITFIKTSN